MKALLAFELLSPERIDESVLNGFDDRIFCQRFHWLRFVQSITNGRIIVAGLNQGGHTVGYFSGILFRRMGVPILGSPFRGWTTPYMGFNLPPNFPRTEALCALARFAFGELGCLHLEVADRRLTVEDGTRAGFAHNMRSGYLSDLTASEDQIFQGMTSACRRAIRKAEKSGVVIEEASPEGFAEEYHTQLEDVFAKQDLRPTYSADRVARMISHVHPSGDLLLIRAREPGGRSIATGLYPAFGSLSFFWGNGSLREHQHLRPNEALHWYAMRYWKNRGMRQHEWGGAGDYKAKYGGTPFTLPEFRKSRYRFIQLARDTAERAYYFPRKLKKNRYLAKIRARDGASASESSDGAERPPGA
jgi:hypothetical protein